MPFGLGCADRGPRAAQASLNGIAATLTVSPGCAGAGEAVTVAAGRTGRRPDWPGWAALGWAAGFGLLYARMVVEQKAPGLLQIVRQYLGR